MMYHKKKKSILAMASLKAIVLSLIVSFASMVPMDLQAQCSGYLGGPPSLCIGSYGTLTFQGGNTSTSYQLYLNGGVNENPVYPNSMGLIQWSKGPGTYQVKGNSGPCASFVSSPFTISNSASGSSLSISTGGVQPDICLGNSITLTPGGGSGYSWSPGVGSGPITVSPTTNTTYTLSGIEPVCHSSTSTSITIRVFPKVGQVSLTGGYSFCQGTVTSTTLTASTPANVSSYSWNITSGAGSLSASSSNTVTVTWNPAFSGNATVTVTAYSPNGCSYTTQASTNFLINPQPANADVTSPFPVLYNTAANLMTSRQAGPNEVYKWYDANGNFYCQDNCFTPVLNGAESYTYYATRYNTQTGCESPISQKVPLNLKLFVNRPSSVTVSANTCGPKTISATAPPLVTYYLQTDPNGRSTANPLSGTSSTITASGQYYVNAQANTLPALWSTSFPISVGLTMLSPVNIELNSFDLSLNNATLQATNSIILKPGFNLTLGNTFYARIAVTPECNDYVNWDETILYNENGVAISDARTYYDGFGNPLESQAKSFSSNTLLANQTIYDASGNPAVSTLTAPLVEKDFVFKDALLYNSSGQPYSISDFDTPSTLANPTAAGRPFGYTGSIYSGTVGEYYSSANTLEPNTPTTSYPYARSYTPPGPNPLTTKSAGPGDAYRMGSNHESQSDKSVFSNTDLPHYFALRSFFVTSSVINYTGVVGYRVISTDPDRKQSATFTDADGRTLASVMVSSGYGVTPVTYDNNTWSYNYYNDAGQLVASVAPNGIASGGTLVGTSSAPNFVTTYKYDQLGRLIETTSPDEGTSQFVYSTDGKIRFSQNQEQRNASPKRFSYTNYDYLGRLVESGEYSCSGTSYFNFDATDVGTPSSNSVLSIADNNIPRGYDVETITAGSTDASYFNGPSVTLDNTRCTDYTLIKYDLPQADLPGGDVNHAVQNNMVGQVAKTKNANATTWYSYDEFGQVEWTKQYISTASPVTLNQQPVSWTNLVNVTQTGTTLTKTGGVNATWDAGAFSVQYIPADADGYLEFTASETTKNKMMGLSSADGGAGYTTINYAIYFSSSIGVQIFENGGAKASSGAFVATDVFRIERQGSTIYYKKNGTLIYTSTVPSRTALYGDCSFNSSGGTLKNYALGVSNGLGSMGYQVQPAVQWASLTNVTQNGTSLSKTGGTAAVFDAGAFSVQSIPAGTDGYVEFSTQDTTTPKMMGLSSSNGGTSYTTINYSISLGYTGSIGVYENGSLKGGSYGTYTTTDVFRVERRGSTIYYKKNGGVFYTSTISSTSALYADCSFRDFNSTLTNISLQQSFGPKTVDYTYDFLGNVKQVAYQKGQNDAFYYHYTYDQDGRLVTAATSFDGTNITPQAKYYYYLHGPLKRVELANNLQGVDYVYTINGALKGINHADVAKDPGGDGSNGFSSDVFGETLNYFSNDYSGANYSAGTFSGGLNNYYSGQISSASWFTPVDYGSTNKKIYGYNYDNLNRFTNAQWGTVSGSGTYTASLSPTNYNESVGGYDNNGNITALNRKDKGGNPLGTYTYNYTANTNRLASISGSTTVNYAYNNIGQMTQQTEGTNTMKVAYNAYGLTKEVRDGNNTLTEQYFYDDRGDLVKKVYYNTSSLVPFKVAYFVRDASGNVLATYEQTNGGLLALIELPIYGSGRLGMVKMKGGQPKYFYEMNDHLGNVRTVIGTPYTDTFLATMEPANSARETKQFVDITQTAVPYASANHTPDFVVPPNTPVTSSYVSRLNAQQNGSVAPHIVGPGIILPVSPGDVISASVYGYYEGSTGNGTGSLSATTIAAALVSALSGVTPGDPNVLQNSMNSAYNSGGPFAGELNNTNDAVPHAYLNMIQFDGNLNFNASLPSQAVTFSSPTPGTKMPISFSNVTITQPGYVYIWVNVTGNSSNYVYFDDLSVSQLHSPFVAGGDFYPFGLTMDDRQIKSERYRYGYQGQFAEYDSLTKTNQFQLRLYDPRFGRWLSTDPYGQFFSPYVGMGNNPVGGVDPDGGFVGPDLSFLYSKEWNDFLAKVSGFSTAVENSSLRASIYDGAPNTSVLNGGKSIEGSWQPHQVEKVDGFKISWAKDDGNIKRYMLTRIPKATEIEIAIPKLPSNPWIGAAAGVVGAADLATNITLNEISKSVYWRGAVKGTERLAKSLAFVGTGLTLWQIYDDLNTGNFGAHTVIDATIGIGATIVGSTLVSLGAPTAALAVGTGAFVYSLAAAAGLDDAIDRAWTKHITPIQKKLIHGIHRFTL
jgi:RHS repeat-associated protein